jgi:hypothetical protein
MIVGAGQLAGFYPHAPLNGALKNSCPFSGISYTQNSLVLPFKTIIRNDIRNYGAEIATCDPSDTVQ